CLHDLAMESAPPILEQTAIGHLVGESMLEGVLEIWKEPSLVEELGSLKPGQAPAQRVLGELADRLQEPKGHVLADDRGGLQEPAYARGGADRSAGPGSPGPWPGSERSAIPSPDDRRPAHPPGPSSPPASAHSPRGRTGCPPSARSASA